MFILNLIPIPFFIISLMMVVIFRKSMVRAQAVLAETQKKGDKEAIDVAQKEADKYQRIFGTFQPLTTCLILCVAILSFFSPTHNLFFSICIVGGVALSMGGDLSIVNLADTSAFIRGIAFFAAANMVYAIGLTGVNGFQILDLIPFIAGLILWFGIAYSFWPSLGKGLNIALVVFCLEWCYIVARAITLFYAPQFSIEQAIMLTGGLTLYFYGDMRLATHQFINKRLPLTSGPWTYAIGQLLIALSASYFPGK